MLARGVNIRIGQAQGVIAGFNLDWKSTDIDIGIKLKILKTCVFRVLLYACEAWTLKTNDMRQLLAFEMRCYRRLLNVKWYQIVPNKEDRNRVKTGIMWYSRS